MNPVATLRSQIYDFFQGSGLCQQHFFAPGQEEQYVAYYNSMYLLQDATESLAAHRGRGFSQTEPLQSYIEFWGVLQAVIIQQDSIVELWNVVFGRAFDARALNLAKWLEVRELRNVCAGHPTKKDIPRRDPTVRSFMGRNFGGYDRFVYERWEQGTGTTQPAVDLGALIDAYSVEAAACLGDILKSMQSRWP